MNWHNELFLCWMIIASISFLAQVLVPKQNLGILIAVLFIPILMHDILNNIIVDKKREEKK